jgi:hypothetical protein
VKTPLHPPKQRRKKEMITVKKAIEKVFNHCNLIGEDADIYAEMNRYTALRELIPAQRDKVYDLIACRLGFMSYDCMPQVTYFEAVVNNELYIHFCTSSEQYCSKVEELRKIDPSVELVYREWSDGTVENSCNLPDIV